MNAKQAKLIAELEAVRSANAENNLVADEAIEFARAHEDSELHARLTWDDSVAAIQWRRTQMTHIIRAVYVVHNSDAQPVHAYWSPPSYRNGEDGYVHISKMRSDAEIAMEVARDMLQRVRAAHDDLLVAIDALPKLRAATRALGRAVASLEKVIEDEAPEPIRRRPRRAQAPVAAAPARARTRAVAASAASP
jgi:hypothetical protein